MEKRARETGCMSSFLMYICITDFIRLCCLFGDALCMNLRRTEAYEHHSNGCGVRSDNTVGLFFQLWYLVEEQCINFLVWLFTFDCSNGGQTLKPCCLNNDFWKRNISNLQSAWNIPIQWLVHNLWCMSNSKLVQIAIRELKMSFNRN